MKTRISKMFFAIALLMLISSPMMAFARHGQQGWNQGPCPEKKVFRMLRLAIAKQDDLNLSDDQVVKIQKLMTDTRKGVISKKADIDLIGIDIKSKLMEDPMDKVSIDKLIDQKYELKKEKAKALVNACIELNKLLSEEQRKQLRNICQSIKSRPCPGRQGMGRPDCGRMGQTGM